MSILVDNKPIEVRLKYVDKPYPGGAVGARVFRTPQEEEEWISKENQRRSEKVMELEALKKDIPENLKKDAKDQVKELITFWKRTDWGTQSLIMEACTTINDNGEHRTDFSKYRAMQMEKLMIGWNLKTADDKPIKIVPEIISKLDFSVAIALLDKYEQSISISSEEIENLE